MSGIFTDNIEKLKILSEKIDYDKIELKEIRFFLRDIISDVINYSNKFDECRVFESEYSNDFFSFVENYSEKSNIINLSYYLSLLVFEFLIKNRVVVGSAYYEIVKFFSISNEKVDIRESINFSRDSEKIKLKIISDKIDEQYKIIEDVNGNAAALISKIDDESIRVYDFLFEARSFVKESEDRIEAYKKHAQGIEADYNFAGLYKAFGGLATSKIDELKRSKINVLLMGFVSVIPLLIVIILPSFLYWLGKINSIDDLFSMMTNKIPFIALSVLPISAILLYFFRLTYVGYRSNSAVLLQLQHRQSICAFIQNYNDFTKKEGGSEKFEALIFGGITPDPGAVPSTFDGIEQLEKVIESIKK